MENLSMITHKPVSSIDRYMWRPNLILTSDQQMKKGRDQIVEASPEGRVELRHTLCDLIQTYSEIDRPSPTPYE